MCVPLQVISFVNIFCLEEREAQIFRKSGNPLINLFQFLYMCNNPLN